MKILVHLEIDCWQEKLKVKVMLLIVKTVAGIEVVQLAHLESRAPTENRELLMFERQIGLELEIMDHTPVLFHKYQQLRTLRDYIFKHVDRKRKQTENFCKFFVTFRPICVMTLIGRVPAVGR